MAFLTEALRRLFYLQPPLPYSAQIEVTNECNLTCPMCPRIDLKVPIKSIDLKIYKKIVDKLEGVKELILTGWGEPLFHKDIIKMVKSAKRRGFKVRLTTNGTLLTEGLQSDLLDSGIDGVSFSIDGIRESKESLAHPLTKQLENVESFLKKRKGGKPQVTFQSTLHQGKEEDILDVIRFAAKVGGGRVNILRLDARFRRLSRPTIEEEKRILEKTERLGGMLDVQVDFLPYVALTGIRRKFFRKLAPLLYRFRQHCPRTFGYIYINVNGQATPCCSLPLYSVGNLLEESLGSIWQGKQFKSFRQNQQKTCGGCDILKVKQC